MVCSVDNRKLIALTVRKLLRFKYIAILYDFIIINEGPFSRKLSHIYNYILLLYKLYIYIHVTWHVSRSSIFTRALIVQRSDRP